MSRKNITLATIFITSSLLFSSTAYAAGITNLANFDGENGKGPFASLTLENKGIFYGTTYDTGNKDLGTIFSFDPNGNVLTNLANFTGDNGNGPVGSLTVSNGLFYGTTQYGGSKDIGTIFSFDPVNNFLNKLAEFTGDNGDGPQASLTLGSKNIFYSTTTLGGSQKLGTVYSFNPDGNVITNLANFDSNNGSNPYGGLTLGSKGVFYGTASSGGSKNKGTIFSFNPDGNILSNLADFTGDNGSGPRTSLTLGSKGVFYGTTFSGGSKNQGTIFSFNPDGNVITDLADFTGDNGNNPEAALTLGSNGLFYGTTYSGGTTDRGIIFSFNPDGNVLTSLASFTGDNGSNPYASLTYDSKGLFYGTTFSGGPNDQGTIYSFDSQAVPEPFTILGSVTTLGLGVSLKRRLKK